MSREEGKLCKPSFLHYLSEEKSLKLGDGVIKAFASDIFKFVSLPHEIITYFIYCRTFFTIRITNRNLFSLTARKIKSKITKWVK